MTGTANEFDTAAPHHAWDRRWSTVDGRAEWLDPEENLRVLPPELRARECRDALDLGCGVGRHALFLAESGFAVKASTEVRKARLPGPLLPSAASALRAGRRVGPARSPDGRC